VSEWCPTGWKRPHHFEGRYDEHPTSFSVKNVYYDNLAEVRELMVTRTYVRDVCVRCGKTIERSKPCA
jgi:hypothetical protein